jgi:hypothetical protein
VRALIHEQLAAEARASVGLVGDPDLEAAVTVVTGVSRRSSVPLRFLCESRGEGTGPSREKRD